ncbi:MAG: stage III sporulation protein AB [Eubacteriales bacterium]
MLKFLLCIGIIALCGYIGQINSKKYTYRLKALSDFKEVIYLMDCDIRQQMYPLDVALKRRAEMSDKYLAGFLNECAQKINTNPNERFEDIWKAAVSNYKDKSDFLLSLNKEEMKLIMQTGKRLVFDSDSSKGINAIINDYELKIKKLSDIAPGKQKLINALSLFGGFLLVILII